MATFPTEIGLSLQIDDGANISTSYLTEGGAFVFDAHLVQQLGIACTLSNVLPISEIPVNLGASVIAKSGSGNDDFYNRIIISPSTIDAGKVITTQTYQISVWNGYLVTRTMSAITASNADGISLVPSEAVPSSFAGLEEQLWTLNINTVGPPLIETDYTLAFDSGDEHIDVVGTRIFAWTFEPNWARSPIERLEWKTDVITSHNGSEQRIALRTQPRRIMEYQIGIVDNAARNRFEALLYGWGARSWLIPIWWEGQFLSANLAAGSESVTLSRVSADWYVGVNAVIWRDSNTYEIVEIDAVSGLALSFKSPTQQSWTAGIDRIYPAYTALLESQMRLDRFTGQSISGVCRFRLDTDGAEPSYSPTNYRSAPVITEAPVWVRDLTSEYQRMLSEADFGTGRVAREDQAGMPFLKTSHHWVREGKSNIDVLRALFYAQKGRQRMAWLPSFLPDLEPVAQISAGGTIIDVRFGYIQQQLATLIGRRDIRIESVAGAVYYRRITAVAIVNADTERVTVDTSVPVTLQPADVARISWMMPVRLDTDAVEFAWRYDDWLECSATWRLVRDDV